jgi:hypothetical protein
VLGAVRVAIIFGPYADRWPAFVVYGSRRLEHGVRIYLEEIGTGNATFEPKSGSFASRSRSQPVRCYDFQLLRRSFVG